MPENYPCLCEATNYVLRWCRLVGILPLVPVCKRNHFATGCSFNISIFWLCWSIIIQVLHVIYVICTTIVQLYRGPENNIANFDWYLMTIGYLIMHADISVILLLGVIFSNRIGKTLERISKIYSTIGEMAKIKQQLKKAFLLLMLLYLILLTSFLYTAWSRMNQNHNKDLSTILDSPIGIIIRGISGFFSQIQCAIVVTLCLLISSKYQCVADTIDVTMNQISVFPIEQNTKIIKVKRVTKTDNVLSITTQLEQISEQYQETNHCLTEINHCIGFQLLITLSANLFVIVYYLYRFTTDSKSSAMKNDRRKQHCVISLICLFMKLLLYMAMGQNIKTQSRKPSNAMQKIKLLRLPKYIQEQIQSLISQWQSIEFGQLSAFNVINVGPWLLAPIAGNVITYLLVAIQFDREEYLTSDTTDNNI